MDDVRMSGGVGGGRLGRVGERGWGRGVGMKIRE